MVIETHKKCLRCGYEWESRVKRPVQCPRCKRYWWDIARRAGATIVIEGDAHDG